MGILLQLLLSFILQIFQYAVYSNNIGSSNGYLWYCADCADFSRERVKSRLLPDLTVMCHPPIQSNPYCMGRFRLNFTCACCEATFKYASIGTQMSTTAPLEMEMIARNGSGVLLMRFGTRASVKKNKSLLPNVIGMSKSHLKLMPINICDFVSVILLDLSHNHLSQLRPLSCLEELHTLDVSHNRLTFIANTTFENMTKLRFIDLSHNSIRDIEPFTFQQSNIHILALNIDSNLLTSLEWSNIFLLKPSCYVSYANNTLSKITNRDRIYPDLKTFQAGSERCGQIDLSNNSIQVHPIRLYLVWLVKSTLELFHLAGLLYNWKITNFCVIVICILFGWTAWNIYNIMMVAAVSHSKFVVINRHIWPTSAVPMFWTLPVS